FPDVQALAEADEDQVLKLWSGLGYYARARNLHKAAKRVCDEFAGVFPDNLEQMQTLPGIGRSTAAAILSLASQQSHAILDGNVKRVLSRYHAIEGWTGKAAVLKQLWAVAEQHLPASQHRDYTQAMMDLGAT
ncbi:PREDICTED: A/G-specific adenine glycosylase-like, partial [Priapulus caudatus]|uniref:Adenine DNA glycosylase n=1 Tax=Priapulus caudatus TaxID=37621 RepID=A0ABM1F806_PRICU